MYILLIHVFHTLVPEIRVHSEMVRVVQYIDVLTCVIYNWNSKDDLSHSFSAVKIIDKDM